jgi:DNA-dependent protein kinase catalytic subunit
LEALFPIFKETAHVHATKIRAALDAFIKKLTDDQAKDTFKLCFKHFMEKKHQDELRAALVKFLCVPLIHKMSVSNQIEVFSATITALMDIICSPASIYTIADHAERKTFIVEKTCGFYFLETLYICLPSTTIREQINPTYTGDKPDIKGNEVFILTEAHSTHCVLVVNNSCNESSTWCQIRSRKIHSSRAATLTLCTQILRDEYLTNEICLAYHASAYNALAAAVVCTQTRENFYTVFLFKENAEKNERLWENIVDLQKVHRFEVETNFPVASKAVALLRSQEGAIPEKQVTSQRGIKYISSQYLADSSLSQDLAQMNSFFGQQPHQDIIDVDNKPAAEQSQ